MAARASVMPGSEMPGIPASETTAMRAPASSSLDDSRALSGFVVFVVADGGGVYAEVVEQLLGLAGVFAGDTVGALEHAERAESDVFEVADGGCDQIESGGEGQLPFDRSSLSLAASLRSFATLVADHSIALVPVPLQLAVLGEQAHGVHQVLQGDDADDAFALE